MKKLIIAFIMIFSLLVMIGCSDNGQDYNYNNLTNESCMNEFHEILSTHAVPAEDMETLINFVHTYNKGSYAEKNLQGDWRKAKNKQHLYDYDEAITSYSAAPFDDLNCREAAFILYHSFINVSDDFPGEINKSRSPLFSDLAILGLQREQLFYDLYEVLFCPFESDMPVSEAVVNYWKSQNIAFEGKDIHLVTLFGKTEGETINIHCGILLESENGLYFFEKFDPLMPYQISAFESTEAMKTYIINRPGEDDYEDKTVFVDDKAL